MANVCLYFQIHQPWRLKNLSIMDLGRLNSEGYHDDYKNAEILHKVVRKSYRPMLKLLQKLITEEPTFRASFSVSGVAIDQFGKYSPDIIELLKELSATRQVEMLSETYYHSLSSLYSPVEFLHQVQKHKNIINDLFNQNPKIFRNTELIYTNQVAEMVKSMGFSGMLAEGADRILKGRKPSFTYMAPCGLPLLLKHYQLSDDIAFRFSESARSKKPLTADTFNYWINNSFSDNETVNLFMDFETFGEHQWEDTGIFDFFYYFVKQLITTKSKFVSVSEAVDTQEIPDVFDSESPVSWADVDRDITAWRGNELQDDALRQIYSFENKVIKSGDSDLIEDWRRLQTSDHYYYMCTKWANDGDVHAYFSPYKSPHLAYVNFNNAITDIKIRLNNINNG